MKSLIKKTDNLIRKVVTANRFQKNTFETRVEISNDIEKDYFICKATTKELYIRTELCHSKLDDAVIRPASCDNLNVLNIELFLDNYKLVDEAIDMIEANVDTFLIDEMDKINKLVKGK